MPVNTHINTNKLWLQWQSSALLILQVFLTGAIIVSLIVATVRYQKTIFSTIEPKNSGKNAANFSRGSATKEVKPLSFYSDLVERRDIFRFEPIASGGALPIAEPASQGGMNFSSQYIVQGIIFDKNPQAIIKDVQSGKTYFVHRNESLGSAILSDIQGNQVTFNLAGETVQLIKK